MAADVTVLHLDFCCELYWLPIVSMLTPIEIF